MAISQDERGKGPVAWAVRYGNRGAIHVLLDHGARPDIDDDDDEVLDL